MRFLCALLFASAATQAAPVSFSRQVAPVLAGQCLECHRAEKAKGSYRLDTFEQLLKSGDSGDAAVTPGKPEASLLHTLLITHDEADRMPKKADPLPEGEVALIRQWIVEGARFDGPDPRAPLTTLLPEKRPQAPGTYPRPIPVTAMALNGDGKVLVTSGYHEVLAWDPATGQARARFSGMPERVLALSFVRGGPWLAVAGGTPGRLGEVWLVNYANPAERKRLAQMRDCVLCAATTPDGTRLITGGADNRVRAFSLPEGRLLWNLEVHADWILSLAISPDGRHVATGSRDRTAKVLRVEDGVVEGTFDGQGVPVLSLTFAPNSAEVMSGGADGQARRWDLNGNAKKDTTLRPAGRSEVLALAFLGQDTPVAASGSGLVMTLDAKARRPKTQLATLADRPNVLSVFGTGDAARVVIGGHDGQVRVVQAVDGKELSRFIASPGW